MSASVSSRVAYVRDLSMRAAAITAGFVFFMGGWRRFINVPAKHDITSPAHLAAKLVEAAPGSPIEPIIHWVLLNPLYAEWSTYMMSTAEVLVGLGLMLGLLTRVSAVGAMLINIALMLIFGWQGYECLDEWTMAALGLAVSVSVMLYGTSSFSIDSHLKKDWFAEWFKPSVAIGLTIFSVVFTIGFYDYFFGIAQLHKRTNTNNYAISAQQVPGQADTIRLYVDAGPSSKSAYIKAITFSRPDGTSVTETASQIEVVRSLFEPWSQSGKVVDGMLKLRLGSMVDIKIPAGTNSAVIDIIDNKDPHITY